MMFNNSTSSSLRLKSKPGFGNKQTTATKKQTMRTLQNEKHMCVK